MSASRDALRAQLATKEHDAIQNIADWLATAQKAIPAYTPAGQMFSLGHTGLPGSVDAAESADIGGKAVRLKPGTQISVEGEAPVSSDKPFTIAAWISIPNTKKDTLLASETEKVSGGGSDEKRKQGWTLRVDKGNLGLYDLAPEIEIHGPDGKSISARPLPNTSLRPARGITSSRHTTAAGTGAG